jgi:hypothetical protein
MKLQLHTIHLERVDISHPKVLKIGCQLSINPECSTSVALPRRIGFDHEFVAVPSVPLGHEVGARDEVRPEVARDRTVRQNHPGREKYIAPLGSLLRMIYVQL